MSATHAQAPEAEELNLKQLLAALGRRWPFILAGMALGGLAAAWTTSRTKPTWEGGFEIVLASKNHGGGLGSALSSNPMLANLAALSGSGGKGDITNLTINRLQMGGYSSVQHTNTSGLKIVGLDPSDIVNIIHVSNIVNVIRRMIGLMR